MRLTWVLTRFLPVWNGCLHLTCSLQHHIFSHSIIFVFILPPASTLFSYFSVLTGNGSACHVTLVTDCVMDGILVRALLCLRHTAGQKQSATSHSTCHTPHPAHVTLYYFRFFPHRLCFSRQPCSASPSICWLFTLVWHYLSFRCVSVSCTPSIIV